MSTAIKLADQWDNVHPAMDISVKWRIGEQMKDELRRLSAERDELAKQEPVAYVFKDGHPGMWEFSVYSDARTDVKATPLYAAPIPAPMADESAAFEAWRTEQIDCLRRNGYDDAAEKFHMLGSVHWSAWQARAALQPAQSAQPSQTGDVGASAAVPEGWLTSLRKAIDEYHAATVARCNSFANDPQQWNRKRREQEAAKNLNALLAAAAPQPNNKESSDD